MMEMLDRQNLCLLNSSDLCKGTITRHSLAAGKVEKSVLDYIIVSEGLYKQFEEMLIVEERYHVLTKYATTKGMQKRSESDHNILYSKFKLIFQRGQKYEQTEVFNFKNPEAQKQFLKKLMKTSN